MYSQQTKTSDNKNSFSPAATRNTGLGLQCKLDIGSVNDPLEAEADAMADRVMRMPESFLIQRKPLATSIAPSLQTKGADGSEASAVVINHISATKGNGRNLDSPIKSFMESRFGTDFSDVNIHTGHESIQMNRELNAQAFTVGNDIYFNSGKYAPDSDSGKYLLAHELTHTVQQGGTMKSLQKQEKDKSFAPKLEIEYKLLPPHLQFKLFHLLLAGDTSKLHLDYTARNYMAGLSYQYGDALSLDMKFNDFSTKLGWQPSNNNLSLDLNYGRFNSDLSVNPWKQQYGLKFHYGATLLPFQDDMKKTFMAGGNAFGNMGASLPGAINDPVGYYQQHKADIEDISQTVDLVKKITEAGQKKIRFGTGFSLTYDPVNKVVVTAEIGFLF